MSASKNPPKKSREWPWRTGSRNPLAGGLGMAPTAPQAKPEIKVENAPKSKPLEPASNGELTPNQVRRLRFAQGIWVGMAQREAAAKAGFCDGPGLAATASRVFRHPEVQAELRRLIEEGRIRAHEDREEIGLPIESYSLRRLLK